MCNISRAMSPRSPAFLVAIDGSSTLLRGPFRWAAAAAVVLDARYYDAWARDIAGGAWIGKAPAWVDPLYAYVLGVVYAVAGHHLVLARILNAVFGVVTVLLVARLAYHVWRSRAAAV